MTDTLITASADTAASDAAVGDQASAAAPADSQQQQQSEAGQATSEEAGQGAGKDEAAQGGDTDGEAAKGGEGEDAPGAPEAYADFTMPEGFALEGEMLETLTATAKELNLPQEAAQKLVDLGVKQAQSLMGRMSQTPVPFVQQWSAEWVGQVQADAEIGGDNLKPSLATASQALEAFGSPGLTQLLNTTGLGNHPEVIRLMVNVGKAISEDRLVTRNGSESGGNKTPAKTLYPDMK